MTGWDRMCLYVASGFMRGDATRERGGGQWTLGAPDVGDGADLTLLPCKERASFDALGTDRALGPVAYRNEDFPGCESFPLPASDVGRYEGRLEFWDGVTETACKVREPTSIS